jgi:acyl-CoA thioesterase-1
MKASEMHRVLRAYLVVLVLFPALACGKGESRTPAPAPASSAASTVADAPVATYDANGAATRPRIVFLGDSLTAGLGLDRDQSVPALVQQQLDRAGYHYEVVNAGVSGDTSAGGLSRLDWSLQGDVQILVVELGANDGLRGLPVANTKQNLETIIERAQGRGIRVLLTGMEALPQYGQEYTSAFHRIYVDLAHAHPDVTFMPFYLADVAGIPSLNQGDGIHPNPAGARIVEANVWRALQPLLERTHS